MPGSGSPEHGTVSKIDTRRRGWSVGRRRRLPLGSVGGCATGKCPSKSPSAPTFALVPWGHRGQALIPLGRPATIVFTSGSTGVPKAVLHTCGNHYCNALGSNTNLPPAARDPWLSNLPLHHVAGLGILQDRSVSISPVGAGGTEATATGRTGRMGGSSDMRALECLHWWMTDGAPNRWLRNPLVARPSRGAEFQITVTRGPAAPVTVRARAANEANTNEHH